MKPSSAAALPRFAPPEQRLPAADRQRLLWMAPLFDVTVHVTDDWMILSGPSISGDSLCLPVDIGYARLLAEIASATIFWIPYGPRRPAESYLLPLSDDKIRRIAELRRRRLSGAAVSGR